VTMTYEEFLEWADEDTHAEWVDGEVIETSPESGEHQNITGLLYAAMRVFVEVNRLGELRFERFQMKTGPNLPGREPDILFVSQANLSRLEQTFLNGPADLVVEVISPESQQRDRDDKYSEYEQGGVLEYWLIDPLRKRAEFYQLDSEGYYHPVLPDSNGRYESLAVDGLWLNVSWLWHDPLPSVLDVLKEWGIL
jgi:Uma2 family endonuclease